MEQKARSVDVTTPRYYKLLYCYHIAHNCFLKGRYCGTFFVCLLAPPLPSCRWVESGIVNGRLTVINCYTAAQCKYEQGWRLGREAPGPESLQKQVTYTQSDAPHTSCTLSFIGGLLRHSYYLFRVSESLLRYADQL